MLWTSSDRGAVHASAEQLLVQLYRRRRLAQGRAVGRRARERRMRACPLPRLHSAGRVQPSCGRESCSELAVQHSKSDHILASIALCLMLSAYARPGLRFLYVQFPSWPQPIYLLRSYVQVGQSILGPLLHFSSTSFMATRAPTLTLRPDMHACVRAAQQGCRATRMRCDWTGRCVGWLAALWDGRR